MHTYKLDVVYIWCLWRHLDARGFVLTGKSFREMLQEYFISELWDSVMCSSSAQAGYVGYAESFSWLYYKSGILFLACTHLYNYCYFCIGKMKILTPPVGATEVLVYTYWYKYSVGIKIRMRWWKTVYLPLHTTIIVLVYCMNVFKRFQFWI